MDDKNYHLALKLCSISRKQHSLGWRYSYREMAGVWLNMLMVLKNAYKLSKSYSMVPIIAR